VLDAFPAELPVLLGSGNSDFEQIDVDASIIQMNAPPLRRKPVVVRTKTEPFAQPPSVVSFPFAEVERIWPKGAESLVKLMEARSGSDRSLSGECRIERVAARGAPTIPARRKNRAGIMAMELSVADRSQGLKLAFVKAV
jgi:hypothetical protein